MLIGAHVSTSGGVANAVVRGEKLGAESIQIFHQSPRAWRPTAYSEEDYAAGREALAGSPVQAVVIHAVYLINCASNEREMRRKSLQSLTHALRLGEGRDEADEKVGLQRLRCLHVNDAAAPLGSCRDRHANIGKGEMGREGLAAFLSEPRFEGLPAPLEVPGPDKHGPDKREVTKAKNLRK